MKETYYLAFAVFLFAVGVFVGTAFQTEAEVLEYYNGEDRFVFETDFRFPPTIETALLEVPAIENISYVNGRTYITLIAQANPQEIETVRVGVEQFVEFADRIRSQNANIAGVNLPFVCARDRGRNEWTGIYLQNGNLQQVRNDPLCLFVFGG